LADERRPLRRVSVADGADVEAGRDPPAEGAAQRVEIVVRPGGEKPKAGGGRACHDSTTTRCTLRGPWAPYSMVCSTSAVFEGPEIMAMPRGGKSGRCRSRGHTSSCHFTTRADSTTTT